MFYIKRKSFLNMTSIVLFKTSNPTEKWDGKYKGVDCPSDVYVYLIVYEFPRHQTKQAYGSITLVR